METTITDLHRVRKGVVDIVDVPEFGYLMIDGVGAPEGDAFTAAVQALYAVSYGVRFMVKKAYGDAPKVMPLEAQWWVDDPSQQEIIAAVAAGQGSMAQTDRQRWQWRAMIAQPEPIDASLVADAAAQARVKKDLAALDRLRYERWTEGRCAQMLHVGPYAEEGPSIARLHAGIAAAGFRPRGRHHEIYIGDARRSAPEKLRTILRQPVEPSTAG
ncbi:MAG TPA: GyrI-like domain-containing protein [Pilimelia sp.]|nr:GyrI-like domain-containing protein [Pilimelia sp.]